MPRQVVSTEGQAWQERDNLARRPCWLSPELCSVCRSFSVGGSRAFPAGHGADNPNATPRNKTSGGGAAGHKRGGGRAGEVGAGAGSGGRRRHGGCHRAVCACAFGGASPASSGIRRAT